MVAQILNWIGNFFKNLFGSTLTFFSNLFGFLFNGLVSVLKMIFKPILIVVAILFYFLYKLAELLITLLSVLLSIFKLLYSFIVGLFKTIGSLVWSSAPPNHGSWSGPIREVFVALEPYQLDKVAYVISFIIWVMTAVAAIRILSARGAAE